ncbi:MAG: hypothetical protein Q8N99_06065 [Nanoarchaeota archaeon]|nr:hypothetical protein [Nanoarchaeota archaeon]
MEEQKTTWFQERGFSKNPFSLEPISKDEIKTKAFVDRTEAKEDIKNFVQEGSGAIIVLSEIGYGKSSMMNFASELSKEGGKTVLMLDIRTTIDKREKESKICFFKALAQEVFIKVFEKQNKIDVAPALFLKNFYANGNENQLHRLLQILKEIFEQNPSVLIMDDLDKLLNFKKHIFFIKEVIDLLPKNIQVISTGDVNQIMNSRVIVSMLYSIFDFPIVLGEIDSTEKLKEFVYGKMEAYAINTQKIQFEEDIFKILLDRTHGNLRETFRYLSELLKLGKFSVDDLINVIIKIDAGRLFSLDEIDKRTLLFLSGNKKTLKEIQIFLSSERIKLSLQMIRFRLDELHQNCWTYKGKTRDSKKIIYSAPEVLKHMIKLENIS